MKKQKLFIAQVYFFMALGVLFTGITIGYLSSNTQLLQAARNLWFFIFLVQMVLVVGLSAAYMKASTIGAFFMYIGLTIMNGLLIAPAVLYYSVEVILIALAAAIFMFLVTAVIGLFVKIDLTRFSGILLIALLGIIIGSFFNMFLYWVNPSLATTFSWGITYISIALFSLLVAIDSQQIKKLSTQIGNDDKSVTSLALAGALGLYLNFINLFVNLLRIVGRTR